MSHNQSRAERTESAQFRKSGRSNHHRNFSGGGSKGTSGSGGGATAPPPSTTNTSNNSNNNNQQTLANNRRKYNVQGGQPRGSAQALNPDSTTATARAVQNGSHPQQQHSHGVPSAPATVGAVKPTDVVTPKPSRAPRAPSSNVSTGSSDSKNSPAPATPAKAEASQSYTLQFGSISPGFMNGMQIPARTSSAPPNLDEQKRDQARHDSLRAPPAVPFPSAPRQQLPKKETGPVDQPNTSEGYPSAKPKRDAQASVAPAVSQTQKPSVHPIPGVPTIQRPFHQAQVPVQFGGPNPQIQSQAMSATSLPMPMPMPMPLPIGNPSVQQQVFVPSLQPHPMQTQGILHQGQNLNFSSQMGPQIPPQVGSIGINMPPQFAQQHGGKFAGIRKAVKITHPETHEELRLDGSPAPRSHPNVPPQSQPISSYTPAHASSYYPGSYNANPLFFQAASHPLSSTHPTQQPPRYYNQVTVKPATSSHGEKDAISMVSSPRAPKGDSQKFLKPSQRDAESSSQSLLQPSKPGVGPAAVTMTEAIKSVASLGSDSGQSQVSNPGALVPTEKPSGAPSIVEGSGSEFAARVDAVQDEKEKVDGQSTSVSVSSLQEPEVVGATIVSTTSMAIENSSNRVSMVSVVGPDDSPLKHEYSEDKNIEPSKRPVTTTMEDHQAMAEISGEGDQEEVTSTEHLKIVESSLISSASEPVKMTNQTMEGSALKGTSSGRDASSEEFAGTLQKQLEESGTSENDEGVGHLVTRSSNQGIGEAEGAPSTVGFVAQDDKVSSLGRSGSIDNVDNVTRLTSDEESMPVLVASSEENLDHEHNVVEDNNTLAVTVSVSGTKEKFLPEPNVTKSTTRGKKKRKELYKKLDSSGPISDLYLAYKGPEERKETVISGETSESKSSNNLEPPSSDVSQTEITKEKAGQIKVEPDDWEDAADISTPKLETSEHGKNVDDSAEDSNGVMTKKYSRDFLLKFADQFTELPEGFDIVSDVAEAFTAPNIGVSRDPYSSSGRIVDRPRLDRRGSALGEEDKWNKVPGPLMTGRDMRIDMNYGPNMVMFRPGQVPNHGVLRNPRMQPALTYPGGILPGQMQSLVPQIGVPRNSPDSERWQRGTAFQKGLMPSPQTPLQTMHKAERKYEIGKVTDEEQAKQRQLKAILNKLTPQNFDKLFEQVKQVNIDNATTLTGVISQIFDKALMEPTFCEMYANFCLHLAAGLPELKVDDETITFKRLLLNKCQEEFEQGVKEEEEANKIDAKGEAEQSAEEREGKRLRARRRMLGNIRLIGELYKKRMLTERIMHECIKKLLGEGSQFQDPDEEDVEALCKLMSTIGEMIDHPRAKEHMDVYFDMMEKLSNNMKLSSRVRFMLKDAIDLRKNKWQQRRKVEGPKKIEEVHRDAAQERQAQARGLARTPSMGPSVRRGQPTDFSPRGSNILVSPSSQMGSLRPAPPQLRGYGGQDVRIEERHTVDNRTLSVPLPRRPVGDDAPFLGPQGGLARGMSFRGHSASSGIQLPDLSSAGEARRVGPGLNGYNPISERVLHSSREDPTQRYMPDRLVGPSAYDQSTTQERNSNYGNRDSRSTDRGFDRSLPMSPARSGGAFAQDAASDKAWPEERLREMSMSTIKEFYSAKDENEVALCIKDLDNPSFYPAMISLWVTDSFERKDMERDLLAKLLITLTKCRDNIISQDQLIKGFDSVLMQLEDAVNDAPKAAEFLGRILARVILERVLPLDEVEHLIYEGGEEQGQLVEIGLAAEVLGMILEVIAAERGDSGLKEFRSGSNLRLEIFKPPGSKKSWRLDKFI